ncbi:MAG: hypothetical protein CMG26_07255 [Candidatus Marinimicrobia bacterium]|nr:hypothetical protein [Candidatus Neomarinimicrobiota bacterium]
MSTTNVFPVNYQSIVNQVMELDILEDYGHLNIQSKDTEFDESRGYTACVFGWSMFCDEIGPFEDNPCYGSKIVGNLYDAENGLGYIGYISEVDGKPYPIIHSWAMRTRLKHPEKGKFDIDKHDAIYYYESLDIC